MIITDEYGRTRTVSDFHAVLMGRAVKLPVATGRVIDTTESEAGQVYVAIEPNSPADEFNCGGWEKLDKVTFVAA